MFFASLRGYDWSWLRGDIVAGLTVWAVLTPESLAYASIAGVSPVVGLYAAPGALILSAVNGAAGARTQLSGLVVAVLTVVTLLLLTGLFESLPEATLAAVVIAAVIELVDFPALRRLYGDTSRAPRRAYGVAARNDFLARHTGAKPIDGLAIVRVEGGLYFANAEAVRTRLLAAGDGVRAVILDAETIPFVDVTAAEMLDRVSADLRRRGVTLVIARDVGMVRDVLGRVGADAALHDVYPSVRAAVIAHGG